MKIETAELKSHLEDYLQQIRASGETITICKAAEPVATLAPIGPRRQRNGANLIDRLLTTPVPVKDFKPLSRDEIYARK